MRRRLRELQDKALDEFAGIPFKLDGIEEVRDQTYAQFKALGLTDALQSMVGFSKPDDVEKLKELVPPAGQGLSAVEPIRDKLRRP